MRQKRQKRNLKPRFAVLGEGITEQWYLQHLKEFKGYVYKISPSLFADVGIEKAEGHINRLLNEGYDQVTFLTDYDTIVSQEKQAVFYRFVEKYAPVEEVLICDSMPAIELWFLLHFVYTAREFPDCVQLVRELRQYLPGYEKRKSYLGKAQWFAEMVKGEPEAIERAERLLNQMVEGNIGKHFPYSKMPQALLEFDRQKGKQS